MQWIDFKKWTFKRLECKWTKVHKTESQKSRKSKNTTPKNAAEEGCVVLFETDLERLTAAALNDYT